MASTFTHIFVGEAIGRICTGGKQPAKYWVLAAICAVLPDADVAGFYLGIKYRSMFGHRGFSHSLLCAAITGLLTPLLAFRGVPRGSRTWWRLASVFFLITASHGVLDAMTDGGYGIGFFIPFDDTRYFLPWRPLVVSPIGVHGFLSRWGWDVMMSEFTWIWMPVSAVLALVTLYRSKFSHRP